MRGLFAYVKSGIKARLFEKICGCVGALCLIFSFVQGDACAQTAEEMISAGFNHYVGVNKYGRVYACGDNSFGQCNTYGWNNVVKAAAGKYFSAALLSDGRVVTCGDSNIDTSLWSGITDIAAGGGTGKSRRDGFLIGIKADGSLISSGIDIDLSHISNAKQIAAGGAHVLALLSDGSVAAAGNAIACPTSSWAGIEKIFAAGNLSVGLKSDGTLLYSGEAVLYPGESSDDPWYWKPSEWTEIKTLDIALDAHLRGVVVAVKNDGTVLTDAKKDALGESSNAFEVEALRNIKLAAVNKNNERIGLLAAKEDGRAVLCGSPLDIFGADAIKEEIKGWNLLRRPVERENVLPDIAPGRSKIYYRLPSGNVCSFSDRCVLLDEFKDFSGLSANLMYDKLSAMDINGMILSNDEKLSAASASWEGMQKVLTGVVEGSDTFLGAMRWDGLVRLASPTTYNLLRASNGSSDGSVIRSYDAKDFVCGFLYTAVLNENGEAKLYAKPSSNSVIQLYKPVSSWSDIEKLCGGYKHIVGIKKDGSVLTAGKASGSYEGWSDIVDAVAGYDYTVGLKNDGTCISSKPEIDVSSWNNIEKIYGGYDYCIGFTKDGEFILSGKPTMNTKIKNAVKMLNNYIVALPRAEGDMLTIDFEGSNKDFKCYAGLFDGSGKLCDIKIINSAEKNVSIASNGAARWKIFLWGEGLKPLYTKEGLFNE